ncbi:DUF4440 domain-containing protein [Sphingomonas antarctica]|uniref:hypothetical protein n=1 Tax=Sphingomonas antarctica TaxID=2040274 RepID=UPI0039E9DFE6
MKPILALALALTTAPAFAQAPAPVAAPTLEQHELMKLIWSTMAAVDQANRTGNYSVLRDLAAPGFQAVNDQAKLTAIFANLRASGVDLSSTLLLAPTYRVPPQMVQPGLVRVQGAFGMRPNAISFDLAYQFSGGQWRLFGIGVSPVAMPTQQAAPQAAPPPKPKGR